MLSRLTEFVAAALTYKPNAILILDHMDTVPGSDTMRSAEFSVSCAGSNKLECVLMCLGGVRSGECSARVLERQGCLRP